MRCSLALLSWLEHRYNLHDDLVATRLCQVIQRSRSQSLAFFFSFPPFTVDSEWAKRRRSRSRYSFKEDPLVLDCPNLQRLQHDGYGFGILLLPSVDMMCFSSVLESVLGALSWCDMGTLPEFGRLGTSHGRDVTSDPGALVSRPLSRRPAFVEYMM